MKNNHIKNLYLHVGMSKTGTSSIQDTLYANRELLEKNDYFYSKKFSKNHSDILRMLFSDAPEDQHTSIKHGLNKEKIELINIKNVEIICQEISETSCSNVIYSGESVSALKIQGLEKLNTFFSNLLPSANIHILISTRNPINFINSLVQQRKRTSIGSKVENFDCLYESKFKKLLTVFGKEHIVAYKFEDACKHEFGPVGHFLNVIGISNDLIADASIIDSNFSISDKAIHIIDFINNTIPMLDGKRISEGRIHLDYSHFYGLTGKKFQLGKDYFDANISIEKLSKSCQWLKDNMGIEYTLKEIPDESPRITYDDVFSEEIKSIYTFLTPVLKKLTHNYVKERIQAPNIDSVSTKTLNQLLEWMVSNHQDIEEHNLRSIIQSQLVTQASDTKHRNQLLKRFKGDDIRSGQFFRDVALFLEHYEMIEESLFFMSKAKMYYPSFKSIDEKLKKYKSILEKTNKIDGRVANVLSKVLLKFKVINVFRGFKSELVKNIFYRLSSVDKIYKKILDNDEILNKILSSDKAVNKILNGNKTLDKILSGDRAHKKILNNKKILSKILSDDRVIKEFTSNGGVLNKVKISENLQSEPQQLLLEDKAKSLGYSLPTYLIGFPRSGTNFLQSVLEGSSGLLCRSIYGPPTINPNHILSLKSHTPSYEFLLDEIRRFLPNSESPDKFILIIRDPRDVFISFYEFVQSTKGVSIAQSDFIKEVSYFFATFEDRHKVNSRKLELAPLSIFDAYKKHIDNWFVNRPPSMDCHVVKYEGLVLSPESEFQRIFDFLNLDCSLEKERLILKVSQYSKTSRKRGASGGWRHCQDEYGELISLVNDVFKKEIKVLSYSEK